jgi:chromosome segregation ATPase
MDQLPLTLLTEQIKKLVTDHLRLKRENTALKKQVAVVEMECKLLEDKQQKSKHKIQQLLEKLSQHEGVS